jgi:hypothetical protein
MYRVIIIIRESLHIIKNDPVDHKDGKAQYKFAGDGRYIKQRVQIATSTTSSLLKPTKK